MPSLRDWIPSAPSSNPTNSLPATATSANPQSAALPNHNGASGKQA